MLRAKAAATVEAPVVLESHQRAHAQHGSEGGGGDGRVTSQARDGKVVLGHAFICRSACVERTSLNTGGISWSDAVLGSDAKLPYCVPAVCRCRVTAVPAVPGLSPSVASAVAPSSTVAVSFNGRT